MDAREFICTGCGETFSSGIKNTKNWKPLCKKCKSEKGREERKEYKRKYDEMHRMITAWPMNPKKWHCIPECENYEYCKSIIWENEKLPCYME